MSIRRAQENEQIQCSDQAFDDYLCMSYEDFKSFVDTYISGCAQWKPGTQKMNKEELKRALLVYRSISRGEKL